MIKTVLFDVDGVLAIGDPWHLGLAQTYGITEEMLSPFFNGPFQACLTGKADLKDELAPYLARWGWQQSTEAFLDYWFLQGQTLDEQLLQIVQHLRQTGLKCYLATQQERYRTEYLLHEMGLIDAFDGMFSSVHIGYMKSDPRFFKAILCKLDGLQPEEVLFWDDTSQNVITAQSVGIQAEVYHDFDGFIHQMQRYSMI